MHCPVLLSFEALEKRQSSFLVRAVKRVTATMSRHFHNLSTLDLDWLILSTRISSLSVSMALCGVPGDKLSFTLEDKQKNFRSKDRM